MCTEQSLTTRHTPVLLQEVLDAFSEKNPDLLFDGTLGGGGHAEALLQTFPEAGLVGFDRDTQAIRRCVERLKSYNERIWLTQASFAQLRTALDELTSNSTKLANSLTDDALQFDCMLLDLGISSDQLDSDTRGFSFSSSAPLDMRMDQSKGQTAADILKRIHAT